MTTQKKPFDKAFMEDYYKAYNSEDAEALAAFYHDDVELASAQGVMRGPKEILATYQYLTSNFHDKMTPESIEVSGNTAVVKIHDSFKAKQNNIQSRRPPYPHSAAPDSLAPQQVCR